VAGGILIMSRGGWRNRGLMWCILWASGGLAIYRMISNGRNKCYVVENYLLYQRGENHRKRKLLKPLAPGGENKKHRPY